MTLLDFIRYEQSLSGTKIGCREGDCGACTILAGVVKDNKVVYQSATSCLMALGNAHGKHIVTIEGLNGIGLNAIQQAFAAEESRQMPVVFVVDPKLPKDVNTITLSYTFFELPGSGPAAVVAPPGKLESGATASAPG